MITAKLSNSFQDTFAHQSYDCICAILRKTWTFTVNVNHWQNYMHKYERGIKTACKRRTQHSTSHRWLCTSLIPAQQWRVHINIHSPDYDACIYIYPFARMTATSCFNSIFTRNINPSSTKLYFLWQRRIQHKIPRYTIMWFAIRKMCA